MRSFLGWIVDSSTTVSFFGYTIRPWTDGIDVSKMGFIMRVVVLVFDFVNRIFLVFANLVILVVSILLIKFGIQLVNSIFSSLGFDMASRLLDLWDYVWGNEENE